MDPDLSLMNADRISWIQSGTALDVLKLTNVDSQFRSYVIRIVDTTLHNPRFSTVVGFSTHYGFLNLAGKDVQGMLTLSAHDGSTFQVSPTVPAGGQIFEVVSAGSDASPGLQLPPNDFGFADFAFIGPPGAISADGYFQAVQNGIFVIASTAWAPRNSQH